MGQGRVVGAQGMGVAVGEELDPFYWRQPQNAVWLDLLELQKQLLQDLLLRQLKPSAFVHAAVELKHTRAIILS